MIIIKIAFCFFSLISMPSIFASEASSAAAAASSSHSSSSSSASSSSSVPVSAPPVLTIRQKIELLLTSEICEIKIQEKHYLAELSAMEKFCSGDLNVQAVLDATINAVKASQGGNLQSSSLGFLESHHAASAALQEQHAKCNATSNSFAQQNDILRSLRNKLAPEVGLAYERHHHFVAQNRLALLELEKKEVERKLKMQSYEWRNERASLEAENARLRALLAQSSSSMVAQRVNPQLAVSIPVNENLESATVVQLK